VRCIVIYVSQCVGHCVFEFLSAFGTLIYVSTFSFVLKYSYHFG